MTVRWNYCWRLWPNIRWTCNNIPILELIDQYTATVARADPDPEAASAFIEMAARLVEMKSYLLLPRSEEGERMKQEFTGQLIEYDQCRRMLRFAPKAELRRFCASAHGDGVR